MLDYEAQCGCAYSNHALEGTGPGIDFCPLHKAAPLLLEAAKAVKAQVRIHRCEYHGPMICDKCLAARGLEDAINAATGAG